MKRVLKILLFMIWVFSASLFTTYLWLNNPNWFPDFPAPLANALVALYGAENIEEVADMEIVFGMAVSLPIVSLLTLLLLKLSRH